MALGSSIALYTCANIPIVLWLGVAGMGLLIAPIVPGLYAVLNNYIEMTAVAMIVPMFGGAISDVAVMYFLGPDYESNVSPRAVWTYMLFFTTMQCLTIVFLQVLCHVHGDRFKKTDSQK